MKKIGKYINSIIKLIKDMDRTLLIVSIVLFVFGLLNIVTASSQEAVVRYDRDIYHYFYVQLIVLFLGFIATIVIIKVNTKAYKFWIPFLFFTVLGLFVYLFMEGSVVKGSSNWIQLPMGFNLQPSEIAKPIIIAFLAIFFERYQKQLMDKKGDQFGLIGVIGFIGLFIPAMVVFQGDVGTAGIMTGIFLVMFIVAPVLPYYKKTVFSLLAIIVVFGILVNPNILTKERIERFTSFIDPCSKYEDGGYQVCNVYIAINNGGLLGLGTGKSQQKYSYIPEPHTDSVFAIIAEEYGLMASIIFVLYAVVLKRVMYISSRASTVRGRYIALGVGVYIFFHIFINMGGLFGLIPLTGVPLPFLTYGGSYTLSLVIALAMIHRVNIETVNTKIKI